MSDRTRRIAELNDKLRTRGEGGLVMMTSGVDNRGPEFVSAAIEAVRTFATFTPDNNPHGERDFGGFTVADEKLFWKIDYYNPAMDGGSEDPADPERTVRLLTIMLAAEY